MLHPFKIDIENTENNRPDLPLSTVVLPSPYLSSRRGLWPKYILRKIVKIVNFRKIVKSNPMLFLKGELQGIIKESMPQKMGVGGIGESIGSAAP